MSQNDSLAGRSLGGVAPPPRAGRAWTDASWPPGRAGDADPPQRRADAQLPELQTVAVNVSQVSTIAMVALA
jgi:hypothetical protein